MKGLPSLWHYTRLRRSAFFGSTFVVLWILCMQSGCLSMRTPDTEWPGKLQKKGQHIPPVFHDVAMPGYRTIHAVGIAQSDTMPLVVLVHGSPGSADAFLEYLADTLLTQAVRFVTLDRPGFGYTSGFGRAEGSLERQAAAVHAVVQALAPQQKVVLVGHSMGAPVIARYAMDYPDRTAGLILVAGSIDPDLEEHPWWQAAIDAPPLCWFIPESFWASNREIKLLEAELRAISSRWAEVRCPVTVIHAINDRLVPLANVDFARRVLTNCPDFEEIILPKGDHFILWSRTDVVREAILKMK